MSMIHEDQVQQAKEIVTAHNRATPTMLERLMGTSKNLRLARLW